MRKVLVCIGLLLLPNTLIAESLDLTQALERGLQQNETYLANRADAVAARAAAAEVAGRRLPQLSFSEYLTWTNEPGTSLFISLNQQRLQLNPDAEFYNDPDDHSDFQSRLQLRQSLYNTGLRYGRQIADKQAAAAAAGEQASGEQLALNILTAYLNVQLAEAQLALAEVGLKESQELLRLARERESAGTGLKADRLSAEARVAENRQQQLVVHNQLEIAQLQLALQVGADEPLQIAAPVSEAQLPATDVAEIGLRPDLAALNLQVEAARLNSRKAAAAWQPQLYAGASWTLHDRDYPFSDSADSWLVNAGLNWVLFDGFSRSHAGARARAEERSLLSRQRQAERQARIDQATVRLKTQTLRRQQEVHQAALVATEESYRLMCARYQSGLSPLAELLRLKTQLERYRVDLAQNKIGLLFSLGEQLFLQGRLLTTLRPKDGE